MPFIPHTEEDVQHMLDAIGAKTIDDLFDEIPQKLRIGTLERVPAGITEMEISALMQQRASEDGQPLLFIGAGAYDHHIPAAVWEITTRGEFYSAYTPYQAEASQGTLQLLYEYQSMVAALTAMDVSNASLYDGASALAEAVLMAVRANRKSKSKRVLIPATLHPAYRQTVATIVRNQGVELIELPFDEIGGHTDPSVLDPYVDQDISALVIPQPNFFGILEDVDRLSDWAAANQALSIAVANPVALALLKPPGKWGTNGVDICCGEGQPLGVPVASGGPYFGYLCSRQAYARQMPGRIIGRTADLDGNPGFTLTLQAREQHIRRSKATSNICTNQGLMVTAATIYMALLGGEGLRRVAAACHRNTADLVQRLTGIEGVEPVFDRPVFHECALRLPIAPADVLRSLAAHNVLGGFDLSRDYPQLGNAILVCATEKRTSRDMAIFHEKLARVIATRSQAGCPVKPKFD